MKSELDVHNIVMTIQKLKAGLAALINEDETILKKAK